jgi:predicted dehydrogenase
MAELNEKVRLALLGCGHMAGLHAPNLRSNRDVELVATCDVSKDCANRWIEKHWTDLPRPQVYDDPAEMYRQSRPDAVLIATPHTWHFEQGMQALAAGCHVLMEKPMVTGAAEAHALAARVRETGKVFTIGYNTPCTPNFGYVRNVIRNKTFGKLEMVSGYLAQNWLRYTTSTWRQDPALSGGGQVYDSGAHLLTSLCWSVESNVEEVFAWVDRKNLAVDVNSCACVRFENGVTASLIVNGNCPVDHGALSFFFDNGKIDVDGWYSKWIRCWHGQSEIQPDLPATATTPVANFIDAILGRDEPRTSPQDGIVHSELVDAIYESARTGAPARPKRAADR